MELDLLSLLNNFGFPVVLAFYLLVRMESKINLLVDTINNLNLTLQSK